MAGAAGEFFANGDLAAGTLAAIYLATFIGGVTFGTYNILHDDYVVPCSRSNAAFSQLTHISSRFHCGLWQVGWYDGFKTSVIARS